MVVWGFRKSLATAAMSQVAPLPVLQRPAVVAGTLVQRNGGIAPANGGAGGNAIATGIASSGDGPVSASVLGPVAAAAIRRAGSGSAAPAAIRSRPARALRPATIPICFGECFRRKRRY